MTAFYSLHAQFQTHLETHLLRDHKQHYTVPLAESGETVRHNTGSWKKILHNFFSTSIENDMLYLLELLLFYKKSGILGQKIFTLTRIVASLLTLTGSEREAQIYSNVTFTPGKVSCSILHLS